MRLQAHKTTEALYFCCCLFVFDFSDNDKHNSNYTEPQKEFFAAIFDSSSICNFSSPLRVMWLLTMTNPTTKLISAAGVEPKSEIDGWIMNTSFHFIRSNQSNTRKTMGW